MKTPLGKQHIGHTVFIQHGNESSKEKLILDIDEDAGIYFYKYKWGDPSISDALGYSKNVYNESINNRFVVKFNGGYSQPFNLKKEIHLFVVTILHGILKRWGFGFEN